MSTPIKTGEESVYRSHPYTPLEIVQFSGADPDQSDVARPLGSFKELHNMRFESPGTPITRTGYKEYQFQEQVEAANQKIHPLATTEYAVWSAAGHLQNEYRYHATLVWEQTSQTVKLVLLDKIRRDGTKQLVTVATGIPSQPRGCVRQFGSYIIVSLFDYATYIMWPTSFPTAAGVPVAPWIAGWNFEMLGKDVCPMPSAYDFPINLTGDLLCISSHDKDGVKGVMEYDRTSDSDPTPTLLRLPIEAKYWRAGGGLFGAGTIAPDEQKIKDTKLIPRWRAAKKDPGPSVGNVGTDSIDHYMHRGYFYCFVFIRTLTLSDGTKVKLRSNPSSDLFVPAIIYSPFFWSDTRPQAASDPGFPNALNDNQSPGWRQTSPVWNTAGTVTPIPTLAAMTELQALYRKYFQDGTSSGDATGTSNALFWVAHWLGWCNKSSNVVFVKQPPYKCDVTAEELTDAPQTIFEWAAFGITDAAVEEIEVYRTAYEDVDPEKRPVSTPLFQPHVYGLVGSIDKDAAFTDTTKIPDFGIDPSQYDGYLRGQFSGDVAFDYGQSPAVVFGNVRVDYRLLTPTPLVQAFAVGVQGNYGEGFVPDPYLAFSSNASDGGPIVQFFYCYEDRDGYRSAVATIPQPSEPSMDATARRFVGLGAAFTFPYGYAPAVKRIVLFRSLWQDTLAYLQAGGTPGHDPAGARLATVQIALIDPEPGTYLSNGAETTVATTASYPAGDAPKFYEPGAIIYSLPNQPWDWPPAQSEKHHASAPVRNLEDLMGELAVTTDESFTLTLLRAQAPRSERETSWLGCISKDAAVKIEDAAVVLSQHGVYFLVPSRPEKLPSSVTVELLTYMTELIPTFAPLANLRRASMGYLDRRKELWLHIPSSVDLWPPTLNADGSTNPSKRSQPQRTYIFRFGDSIRKHDNYTFDIHPAFEIKNFVDPGDKPPSPPFVDINTYNPNNVLFSAGSDGGLYCSFMSTDGDSAGSLIMLDCDDPTVDFPCAAYGTISLGMSDPSGQKQIERTELLMRARGKVQIITGIAKPAAGGATSGGEGLLAGWDAVRGHIHDRARVWTFQRIVADQARAYNHPAPDSALETKGSTVMVRVRTLPDAQGRHRVELQGLSVFYDFKHQHG